MPQLKKILLTAAACVVLAAAATAAEPPRLVINIIAGSMQAEALDKYARNFDRGGFARLISRGAVFTEARYGWMQTTTPTSLATLATGATPSMHGITGSRWYDYTQNTFTDVTADTSVKTLGNSDIRGGHSPRNTVAPTLVEMLLQSDPLSRAVTIALKPASAVITAGHGGHCLWMDGEKCRWTTSTAYAEKLPVWVDEYNGQDMRARFLAGEWVCRYDREKYINKRSLDAAAFASGGRRAAKGAAAKPLTEREKIIATPAGNSLVFDLAKYAVTAMNLGADNHPDIINICLDAAEEIAARYGCESVEYEDMIYRLDNDIKELLDYVAVHMHYNESVVVVFTAAHGAAPAFDAVKPERERFNARQFELIVSAYLNARYGQGQWVLGYADRALYLNRNLIRDKRLSLETIQSETAAFAMQFRGVSHAVTASALQSGYFADGYASKIQKGFYPRRSGDVIINLMPGRTAASDVMRTESGSMYDYDTHVPLIIYGTGITAKRHTQPAEMTCVAPTLARILHTEMPWAAEGEVQDIE